MRLLITGSRIWDDYKYIHATLKVFGEQHADEVITLVSGECPNGADRLCEIAAAELGWEVELHPANWEQFGKRAGFVRNEQMVLTEPDFCLGFIRNNSKGGAMTVKLAADAGIPTVSHLWTENPAKQIISKSYNMTVPTTGVEPLSLFDM